TETLGVISDTTLLDTALGRQRLAIDSQPPATGVVAGPGDSIGSSVRGATRPGPSEGLPVQVAVLDSLGDVAIGDAFLSVEVGQGPRHAQHLVVGAGAEAELVDGLLQELLSPLADGAILAYALRIQVGVTGIA